MQELSNTLLYTCRSPLGVAGIISPWNLPLYLLSFKIAPAIATGNTVVAKPSELTSVTAWMLCKILKEAGETTINTKQAVEVSTRMPSVSGSHFRLKMLVTSGSYLVTSGILLVTSGPFPVVTSGSKLWSLPVLSGNHFR